MQDYAVFHQPSAGDGAVPFIRVGVVIDCADGADAIKKAKKKFRLIPHPAVQQLDADGHLVFPANGN